MSKHTPDNMYPSFKIENQRRKPAPQCPKEREATGWYRKENTYWDGMGKYQKEYDRFVASLVPMVGPSKTIAGEMIRAANKLSYDFHNNAMVNNTTGPIRFLLESGVFTSEEDTIFKTIYRYAKGLDVNDVFFSDEEDVLEDSIERMIDKVVGHILENPSLEVAKNEVDMWDYEEEEKLSCIERVSLRKTMYEFSLTIRKSQASA